MNQHKPYYAVYPNPLYTPSDDGESDRFTHYEIRAVRDYIDPHGEHFTEVIHEYFEPDPEDTCGPVYFSVYGRQEWGGADCISDLETLEDAEHLLRRMGVISEPMNDEQESLRDRWQHDVAMGCTVLGLCEWSEFKRQGRAAITTPR